MVLWGHQTSLKQPTQSLSLQVIQDFGVVERNQGGCPKTHSFQSNFSESSTGCSSGESKILPPCWPEWKRCDSRGWVRTQNMKWPGISSYLGCWRSEALHLLILAVPREMLLLCDKHHILNQMLLLHFSPLRVHLCLLFFPMCLRFPASCHRLLVKNEGILVCILYTFFAHCYVTLTSLLSWIAFIWGYSTQ